MNYETLFSLKFPTSFSSEDCESYIRYTSECAYDGDRILLSKNGKVSTDTYHNLFPLKKYTELTNYYNYCYSIEGVGEFIIDFIGITITDYYTFENVISTSNVSINEKEHSCTIPFPDNSKYDAVYLKVTAMTDSIITNISVNGVLDIKNDVSIAYCICTFNRETFVRDFVERVASEFVKASEINFYISVNGDSYDIDFPDNFNVIKNRNLGGAGGFTRGMFEALDASDIKYTHIIFADDDIIIDTEVIRRTISLLKGLDEKYSSHFISGSMLSLDEKWLQYERNSALKSTGFEHYGHSQDTRLKHVALENAVVMPKKGLAGWWYCVIPSKIAKEFGYPLPIFVRGDDVEYSIRCSQEIISVNGICVWHEPFIKKYNEVMEDYYLVRNMCLISLIYNDSFSALRKNFIVKKFLKNILINDYVAAEFNLLALEFIISMSHGVDAADHHQQMMAELKEKLASIPTVTGEFPGVHHSSLPTWKMLLILIRQHIFGLAFGDKVMTGGFIRSIKNCAGKRNIFAYQGNEVFRKYTYNYRKSWGLIFSFMKLKYLISKNEKELVKNAREFKLKNQTSAAWRDIFNK